MSTVVNIRKIFHTQLVSMFMTYVSLHTEFYLSSCNGRFVYRCQTEGWTYMPRDLYVVISQSTKILPEGTLQIFRKPVTIQSNIMWRYCRIASKVRMAVFREESVQRVGLRKEVLGPGKRLSRVSGQLWDRESKETQLLLRESRETQL
jgi:hypothetical protein